MRPHKWNYTIFLYGLLILLFAAGCEDYYGDIDGFVTDEETGEPIQNAKVLVVSLKDSTMLETRTDANGYYALKTARYGVNELRVWKDGYRNDKKIADVLNENKVSLNFQLEQLFIKTTINIKIKIVDGSGDPVIGATVDLYEEVQTGLVYAGTEVTETADAVVSFKPGLVEKGETILFEVRVAARGFFNAVEVFQLEWNHAYPSWTVEIQKV